MQRRRTDGRTGRRTGGRGWRSEGAGPPGGADVVGVAERDDVGQPALPPPYGDGLGSGEVPGAADGADVGVGAGVGTGPLTGGNTTGIGRP